MAKGMHKPGKLKRRQEAYDAHGQNPNQNPSNSSGQGHDMHRPGSFKK
jgi:hypothetical protein